MWTVPPAQGVAVEAQETAEVPTQGGNVASQQYEPISDIPRKRSASHFTESCSALSDSTSVVDEDDGSECGTLDSDWYSESDVEFDKKQASEFGKVRLRLAREKNDRRERKRQRREEMMEVAEDEKGCRGIPVKWGGDHMDVDGSS
ncbi:hypothetical protein P7C70_g89, partial [Phenoliferia sp. Uapishka_3]